MKVLCPVLDMTDGYGAVEPEFIHLALELGADREEAAAAFQERDAGAGRLPCCLPVRKGDRILAHLERNPSLFAVVLTGRTYNAMSSMGNMGIPRKFASRGIAVIPQDFLPLENEADQENMYWASGRTILKAARFTARSRQLFGTLCHEFQLRARLVSGRILSDDHGARKPSLTLELDAHTADAGIDTRIEAFLDVVRRHRILTDTAGAGNPDGSRSEDEKTGNPYRERIGEANSVNPAIGHSGQSSGNQAKVEIGAKGVKVVDADGNAYDFTDPRVKVLVPSMGEYGARLIAATLRHVGCPCGSAAAAGGEGAGPGTGHGVLQGMPAFDSNVGRPASSVQEKWDGEGVLVNFMPETSGPCRFGQYNVAMREVAARQGLQNVTTIFPDVGKRIRGIRHPVCPCAPGMPSSCPMCWMTSGAPFWPVPRTFPLHWRSMRRS